MSTFITVTLGVSLALLIGGAAMAVYRISRGPEALDRVSALDVLSAAVVGVIIVLVVLDGRRDLAGLMIVFVLTAFFSAVIVARSTDKEP